MEMCDYSESQSLSDSTAASSDEEGEGGSGGSSSCIRYLSFIQGLTSSWRGREGKGEREREKEREREREGDQYSAWHTQINNFFYQFTLSRSDSRNGINCRSSESDSSMNQLAIGIPLSS